MSWQYSLYLTSILASFVITGFLVLYAWRHRITIGATTYTWLVLLINLTILTDLLSILSGSKVWALFWFNMCVIAVSGLPVLWLIFALQYTGRQDWVSKKRVLALFFAPFFTQVLVWTNNVHGLWMRQNINFFRVGPLYLANLREQAVGPWFIFLCIYSFILMLIGAILFLRQSTRLFYFYRLQAILLVIGSLVSVFGSLAPTFSPTPDVRLYYLPQGLAAGALMFVLAIYRYQFLGMARNLIVDLGDDDILVLDIHNRLVDINLSMRSLLSEAFQAQGAVLPANLMGKSVAELIIPLPELADFFKAGVVVQEEKIITLNTLNRFYGLRVIPLVDKRGVWGGRVFFLHDLTERMQAEQALRTSEERYRSLFDHMQDGVYLSTHEGKFVDINPAMVRMFGFASKEQMLVVDIKKELYFVPEERGSHVLDTGKVETEIYRMRRKDGTEIWVEDHGSYVHDAQGRIIYHEGILRDVTERKRAEDAVHESEERLRTVLNGLPVVLFATDLQGIVTFIQGKLLSVMGLTPQQVLGRPSSDFFPNEKIIREGITRILAGEEFFTTADFAGFCLEVHLTPLRGVTEEILGTIGVVTDVTERKQLTEKMLQSEKLVGLGTLSAGVAHEINSPLQVITGDSESIIASLNEETVEKSEILRRLERINRNGWRIAKIIHSLLAYARSKPGELTQTDLNQLIRDALLLIEHQIHVWSNIQVITQLDENLPEFTCDRNKIVQVLINLLSNARDAMPDGGLATIRTTFDPQRQNLTLTVSDTGQGIPEAFKSKIFDPFFTTKPPGEGTGLGLSIVVGIVHAHGGEIKVESMPKKGSTFILTFPLIPPPFSSDSFGAV